MPGDISRETFRREKHYNQVRMQQGRVQVDSDQNEELAISAHRTETETIDVIGACGVPEATGGFQILLTSDGGDLVITPGRIYVEGVLCELESATVDIAFLPAPLSPPRFASPFVQANRVQLQSLVLDGRPLRAGELVEVSALNQSAGQFRILGIDQQNSILVLNGSLAAFSKASQPRLRRIATYGAQADYPNPEFVSSLTSPAISPSTGAARLALADGLYIVYLDVWKREITALNDPHIREVALNGPDTATRLQTVGQIRILPVAALSPTLCDSRFAEWDALTTPFSGRMNARTVPSEDAANPCQLPPGAGFQRLENQLYRVEIQNGGPSRANVTFKWSRENASVNTRIENIANNVITVSDPGKDAVLGFANDQWVEIVDEESELKHAPRPLLQIGQVKPATRELVMKGAVPALAGRPGLMLRRWEQSGVRAGGNGLTADAGWLDLEGGVQVLFGEGSYQAGDFWLIPARIATAEIEWPPFEVPNVNPIPQSPQGVRHHFCRLAIATVFRGAITLQDCRSLFPPLTQVLEPARGVHVQQVLAVNPNNVRTRLVNDRPLLIPEFAGIDAICDQDVAAFTVQRPTCFVTVETPIPTSPGGQPPGAYTLMSLGSATSSSGNVLSWRPTAAARQFLSGLQIPTGDRGILTRFTLKGNFIWAAKDPGVFLDGEVFGFREAELSNLSARLPSGNRIRGGDLDMWFWLTRPAPPPPFRLDLLVAPSFFRIDGQSDLAPDIILKGLGGNPTPQGTNVPEYNVQLIFNSPVTNFAPNALADVVLLLCDPVNAGEAVALNTTRFNNPAPPVAGIGGQGVNFQDGSAPNIFQGRVINGNTVLFTGIPIDPPGFGQRVLRIKNVRLNGNALSFGGVPPVITVSVTVSGPGPAIPPSTQTATVGFVSSDLDFSVLSPGGAPGPVHIPLGPLNAGLLTGANRNGAISFLLSYRETVAAAFKVLKGASDDPFAVNDQAESGYGNVGPGALTVRAGGPLPAGIGVANSGTRFQASFGNIPQFINVFVTTRDVPPGGVTGPDNPPAKAVLIVPPTGGIPGPVSPGGVPLGNGLTANGVPVIQIGIAAAAGLVTWEFVARDPVLATTFETLNFGIVLASGNADNVPTAPVVNGALAPITTSLQVVPRFAGGGRSLPTFTIP